jgi:uncharacterized protein
MQDMGAANRKGLRHSLTLEQRKKFLEQAAAQRDVEFAGGALKYTSATPEELDIDSSAIDREFYDFYRTPRGVSHYTTTHPTLTSNVKFMNFYTFSNNEAISPRPMLFITSADAHSREFGEEASHLVGQPKELVVVPSAGHLDLYDRANRLPFDKLTSFFRTSL